MLTATRPVPLAPEPTGHDSVIAAFATGGAGVLLDRNGAVLGFPAATATTAQLHFAIRHSSGLIHAAMPSTRLDALRIPDQWRLPSEDSGADFTVAVDASHGITTGISAADRAHTLRVLGGLDSAHDDLVRPGHILPIRCADGGFDARPRPWELAIELVVAAGHSPVAVACRLVDDDGETIDAQTATAFAAAHRLPMCAPPKRPAGARRHLHVAGAEYA